MIEKLEQRAARERVVYVPVSVELAAELEQEELGPIAVRLEPHPSADPLLRQMIVRTLS